MKKWTVPSLVAAALTGGCIHTATVDTPVPAGTVSIQDNDIGLSKVGVLDVAEPISFELTDVEPGEGSLTPPPFHGAPAVISHSLEDVLPITYSENLCIDCHEVEREEPGEPTPIPESHYVDIRNAPGRKQEQVVGTRYNCVLCHAFDSNSRPLVKSTFNRR